MWYEAYPFLILFVIFVGLGILGLTLQEEEKRAGQSYLDKYWHKLQWIPLIIGFALINVVVWTLFPDRFTKQWTGNWKYILLLFGIALVAMKMFSEPKDMPWRRRVGTTLLVLCGIALLHFFVFLPFVGEEYWKARSSPPPGGNPSGVPAVVSSSPPMPLNAANELAVTRFWFSRMPDAADAIEMIAISKAESGYNQFAADGTVYRGKNPTDVCIMQINEDAHLAESLALGPAYSLNTLEGCLNMALKIRMEEGSDPWVTAKKVREEIKVAVTANRDVWSDAIFTPKLFDIKTQGPIRILLSDGRTWDYDKGVTKAPFDVYTDWVKIQSRTDEPVEVTVSRLL